jgi:hypothetical protein
MTIVDGVTHKVLYQQFGAADIPDSFGVLGGIGCLLSEK